ncbi:MAG: cytidylate kinase-like family protein [Clostridia bacterium]|nr:cytidylate kinase-like family protein [Clostridia bacterium]
MKKRIITISRQFGSGGHSIAKAAAERMGIAFYDNQLITEVAKQSGLSEEFIRENEEYASHSSSFLYQLAMSTAGTYGYPSVYQKLYEAQTKVIRDLADKEPCIIVGRCADYILKEREDCLHVFIHADNEHRAKHILEKYGNTDKSIAQRIKDKDNRRRNYYRFHTDREWGVASNYSLSLDSGVLGEELCVELICKAMEKEN